VAEDLLIRINLFRSHVLMIKNTEILIHHGDITKEDIEAIVNAANSSLTGGGGVDGAIHRAGGPKILEECREIRRTKYPNGLPVGQAVITSGGDLKAKYVIHTVGPVWRGGGEEVKLLRSAYINSLLVAEEKHVKSIAFPSISTGAYGYPPENASEIAMKAVIDYIKSGTKIEKIVFVIFTEEDLALFESKAKRIFTNV
jgi:O-acetyl-ADP-ribose deacetylase (regulator of RNase III)